MKYVFFFYTNLYYFCYVSFEDLENIQTRNTAKQHKRKTSPQSQNSRLSWVSLVGLWTVRPRSSAFRLVQIYIFIIQYLCSLFAQFLTFGYQLCAFLKASLPLERIWNRECTLYHVYTVSFSLQVLFYQTAWSLVRQYGSDISKHEKQCLIGVSKHREESWKYNVQRSIFEENRGVWIADDTLSQVFDIYSQSKQKLKSKRKK